MSDASDPREMLAAALSGTVGLDSARFPLAVIPCLGTRYDRNGFPAYPGGDEAE